jgi:hypothetical protein
MNDSVSSMNIHQLVEAIAILRANDGFGTPRFQELGAAQSAIIADRCPNCRGVRHEIWEAVPNIGAGSHYARCVC